MELPESVESLRKTADTILRHYKQGKAIICDESAKNISEVEMADLRGYVLHQDKNTIALQILNNFKINTVDDQTLINLQNRGGLRYKIIFVKIEYSSAAELVEIAKKCCLYIGVYDHFHTLDLTSQRKRKWRTFETEAKSITERTPRKVSFVKISDIFIS